MWTHRTAVCLALAISCAFPAAAQSVVPRAVAATAIAGLPRALSPEAAGMSGPRLQTLVDRLSEGVEKNELPGAVILIARAGKLVLFDAVGYRDREAGKPMPVDAIFNIASMTKPIVSLAIMMLAEEGKLSIADPVARYIPAFADLKVAVRVENSDDPEELTYEAQKRSMTLHDLLRHTSGLTYGANVGHPLKRAYNELKIMVADQTNEEMVAKLARIGLLTQPGTTWEYGMSTDVLGRIIEVVSGLPLDRFIDERIARPLKLADTGFDVPQSKADRGARPQKEGPGNELPPIPPVTLQTRWKSGGGGMVSSAADYARFCQMLLNGGQLDGVRLVSRKTVELMTSNHLPPGTAMPDDTAAFGPMLPGPEMGQGFGLGFAVRTEAGINPLPGSIGDYFWGGVWGTYFWVDPREKLFVVFMMQSPAARLRYRHILREMVYQAIVN